MVLKTTSSKRLKHFQLKLKMCYTRILLLAVFAFTFILGIYGAESQPQSVQYSGKIVGGVETTIQKHPYQVNLLLTESGTGDKYECGGSIVTNRCVLTAAHCLLRKESVEIRTGSSNAHSGGKIYNSRIIIIHPQYSRRGKDFDLGIIRLMTPIKLDGQNTSTIDFPLNNCSVTPGTNLTVSGWGDTEEYGESSTILREVAVDAVSFDDCKKVYSRLTSRMLCAGVPEGGKDACQGDSGNPLVRTGTKKQVGIVSFGRGCGRPGFPGVYTNLCNHEIQNWLKAMNCG